MKNVSIIFSLPLLLVSAPVFLFSEVKPLESPTQVNRYSLTKGQIIPIPAKRSTFPLIVYGDDVGQTSSYVPSGYMGDATAIEVKTIEESVPLKSGAPGVHSLKISYLSDKRLRSKSKGEGWVGVYWQTPANNWGKVKGAGYDLSGAEKLTFWLRGEKGGEVIAEIKMGGLTGPYPDTDVNSIGPIRLTKDWKQYSISLTENDLRHISGGFAFSLRRADNPHGAIFYLDEVIYEAANSSSITQLPETSLNRPLPDQARQSTLLSKIRTETLRETRKFTIPFIGQNNTLDNDQEALEAVVFNAYKYISSKIIIEGHTDSVGAADVNKKLSLERAKSVAEFLESRGIDKKRISIEGYGEENPLMSEEDGSEEARIKNRRVEVSLLPN